MGAGVRRGGPGPEGGGGAAGAIHSVVFCGFASKELAKRIDDCTPKVILSSSGGIEPARKIPYKPLLDEAIATASHKPQRQIILQRPQLTCELKPGAGDRDWATELASAAPHDCVPVAATDPLYILYTSGTTGRPKGVLRDNGGHAVALRRSMALLYGVRPGDVFWAASDIGWVVGHSYIVYGPLLNGCTTVLYEGKPIGTPDAGAFWRVCQQHQVHTLFTAPTALRAIKREDPEGALARGVDLSSLRAMYLAGERSDPDSLQWASQILGKPVVDHWWMTETGWGITGLARGLEHQPVRAGSAGQVLPGYDVALMDEAGQELYTPLNPAFNPASPAADALLHKRTKSDAEHLRDSKARASTRATAWPPGALRCAFRCRPAAC